MDQHLIALDLDGTTLNSASQLSPTTITTLRQVAAAGHLVVIVTGRPWLITQHLYDQLGLKMPVINFNGALTHFPYQAGAPETTTTVSRALTLDMLDQRQALGLKTLIAEDKQHVWADHPSTTLPEFLPTSLRPDQILTPANLRTDPIALTIQFTPAKKQALIDRITDRYGDLVAPKVWGGGYSILELLHRETHKAAALSKLAHYYQLDARKVIAFGDESNDLEMLAWAGRGVAMRNAIPAVKLVADDVTKDDNAHDGVAHYLQDYFHLPQPA